MIRTTADVSLATLAAYDAIIDVRSPGEFALDHLPGAINLPVLTDDQRAQVGTEYVQGSKFRARRSGAALVARNVVDHLAGALADRPAGFRPLIHCWRGGQRSHALATVMDQVGWPVTVLQGGYRTWRRAVKAALYDTPGTRDFVRIDGPTGSGKTAVLHALAARGEAVLDLEGLANHRGSLFGAQAGGQPSQKLFESRLHAALEGLDPTASVLVEAESSRIGRLTVPPAVWRGMCAGGTAVLDPPIQDRVARILSDYRALAQDAEALNAVLSRLPSHLSKAQVSRWRDLIGQGDLAALVRELIETHYDPAYRRSARPPARAVDAGLVARIRDAASGLMRPPSV